MNAFPNLRHISLFRVVLHNDAFVCLLLKSKCLRIGIYGDIKAYPLKPAPKNMYAQEVELILIENTNDTLMNFLADRFPDANIQITYDFQ